MKISRFFQEFGFVVCSLTVIAAWPLYGSIALRNVALFLGALLSLSILAAAIKKQGMAPIINIANLALLLLLSWVFFRYMAFSEFPALERGELKSLWLRSFVAIVLGTGLGYLCTQSKRWMQVVLLSLSIILLSEYFFGFFSQAELNNPFVFDGFFKSKAAVSYFLLFPFLIACSYINYFSHTQKTFHNSKVWLFLSATVIGLVLFAFYFSRSFNGLLLATLFAFLLIGTLLIGALKQGKHRYLKLILTLTLLLSLLGALTFYGKHDYEKHDSKLAYIIDDAYLGSQIDTYPNWHNDSDKPWVPDAPDGHEVNQSTYYRVANMLNGIRFVKERPLGLGYTYLPYGYLMKEKYPLSEANHTHSGWVDFALGQGIPGLLLLWLAMFGTFILGIRSIKDPSIQNLEVSLWGYATVWVIGGIFVAWITNEVSEREYIEQLFFIIALFAAGNTPYKSSIGTRS